MQRTKRRVIWAITIIVAALLVAAGFALSRRDGKAKSWTPAAEAADWLNEWLYRDRDEHSMPDGVHFRRECTYAKWKVWAGETAEKRPNERHTVWVDDGGFFHGRVDYWR